MRLSQVVSRLQGNLPVLVEGAVWEDAAEELDDRVVGDAEIWCGASTAGSAAHPAPTCFKSRGMLPPKHPKLTVVCGEQHERGGGGAAAQRAPMLTNPACDRGGGGMRCGLGALRGQPGP